MLYIYKGWLTAVGGNGAKKDVKKKNPKKRCFWHLADGGHCTTEVSCESKCPIWTPLHCTNLFSIWESTGGLCRGDISGSNYNTAYVCRSEYREGRWTDNLPFQGKSSSALIVSSTIYISNHFSCKLHASTLTRTKDGTINYRQIQVHYFLKDTRAHYVKYEVIMFLFLHRAEFDWSWTELCDTERTLTHSLVCTHGEFEMLRDAAEHLSDQGNSLHNITLAFCCTKCRKTLRILSFERRNQQ